MPQNPSLISRMRAVLQALIGRGAGPEDQLPTSLAGVDPMTLDPGRRNGLLVAFTTPQSAPAITYLRRHGVHITRCANGLSGRALAQSRSFDTIAIDVEHVDDYAPTLIRNLREMPGPSNRAWIVVFGTVLPGGLRQQFEAAGADMVLTKRLRHGCAPDLNSAFGIRGEEKGV